MISARPMTKFSTVLIDRLKCVNFYRLGTWRKIFLIAVWVIPNVLCLYPSSTKVTNATTYTHHNPWHYFVAERVWNKHEVHTNSLFIYVLRSPWRRELQQFWPVCWHRSAYISSAHLDYQYGFRLRLLDTILLNMPMYTCSRCLFCRGKCFKSLWINSHSMTNISHTLRIHDLKTYRIETIR
jgi:hypothetical protein